MAEPNEPCEDASWSEPLTRVTLVESTKTFARRFGALPDSLYLTRWAAEEVGKMVGESPLSSGSLVLGCSVYLDVPESSFGCGDEPPVPIKTILGWAKEYAYEDKADEVGARPGPDSPSLTVAEIVENAGSPTAALAALQADYISSPVAPAPAAGDLPAVGVDEILEVLREGEAAETSRTLWVDPAAGRDYQVETSWSLDRLGGGLVRAISDQPVVAVTATDGSPSFPVPGIVGRDGRRISVAEAVAEARAEYAAVVDRAAGAIFTSAIDRELEEPPMAGSKHLQVAPNGDGKLNAFYWLYSQDPGLIYYKHGRWQPTYPDLSAFGNRPVFAICGTTFNTKQAVDEVADWCRAQEAKWPNRRAVMCCDTPQIRDYVLGKGVAAYLMNENALHDESLFDVDPKAAKIYDAVYAAAPVAFKRLELLKDLGRKTLWIPGRNGDTDIYEATKAYPDVTCPSERNGHYLHASLMPGFFNSARTGLALSKTEGSMRAACEYALCGLPLVQQKGEAWKGLQGDSGRTCLFPMDYVFDLPEITTAWLRRTIDRAIAANARPELIRKIYLDKRKVHRAVWQEILDTACDFLKIPRIPPKYAVGCHTGFLYQSRNRLEVGELPTS